ncbi:hypothetical protein PLICRDRAFT_40506 [Plicaturopsis crispa FD-325 SS-3]|nr:hypothetical protein PLICRDRAFT_40506 [Plicaturopsis crispa FD-325 SS-3]
MANSTPSNSLGLDFDSLKLQEDADPKSESVTSPDAVEQSPSETLDHSVADGKDKKKSSPYVNPERVRTGGTQRDKLSEQELSERMARMKEQNDKIKQRRLDVKADEDAFKKTQESERLKQAKIRKEQENVDRTREQNARRKMDKVQSREWDSGKATGDWKQARRPAGDDEGAAGAPASSLPPTEQQGGGFRGGRGNGNRGRGRGRGRGSFNAPSNPFDRSDKPAPAEEKAQPVEAKPVTSSAPVAPPTEA